MIAAFTQDNNRLVLDMSHGIDGSSPPPDMVSAAAGLAALGCASLTGQGAGAAIAALPCDPTRLAALAVRTRLTGLCERAFAAAGEPMPLALAEALRATRARSAVSNGRVVALARIAFPILERAGIPVIAFKGPFQHRQIHGDPFFCRSGDLDLLVPRGAFVAALAAFEAEGFVRREGTSPWWTSALGEVHLVHPEGGVIDLHYRLQQPGCPPPHDLGHFFAQAERTTIFGVDVDVPSRGHTVLICALNLTKEFAHRRLSARYAHDFAAGIIGMDEPARREFAALAVHQRLTGTVGFAAALAGTIFGCELPLAPPLAVSPLPDWATRDAVLAMAFDPDSDNTPWPRRRAVLWALCSDTGPVRRTAEFSREGARMIASEALRRLAGVAEG